MKLKTLYKWQTFLILQKTAEHRVEEFMKNFQQSVEEGLNARVSSNADTKEEEVVSTFKSGHVWTITDTAAGLEVIRLLRTTCARPSLLEVTGVNWAYLTLSRLLIEVSELRCPVRMRFLDIFWNPGKKTEELTQSRLETLLKLSCRWVWKMQKIIYIVKRGNTLGAQMPGNRSLQFRPEVPVRAVMRWAAHASWTFIVRVS